MVRWDQYGFHKKCARTRYVELLFLHPLGFVGHVVRSALSRVRNVDALFSFLSETGMYSIKGASRHITMNMFFCIRWDMRVTSCVPVHPGRETSMH
jgi:hypothetical protein